MVGGGLDTNKPTRYFLVFRVEQQVLKLLTTFERLSPDLAEPPNRYRPQHLVQGVQLLTTLAVM